MLARWKIFEMPSQSGMKSRDRILTVSEKFRYEIRKLKKCRMCAGYWVNSRGLEKRLRGKPLSLHRLSYTPETTPGIAYIVWLTLFLCFSMLWNKRVYRKGRKGAGCLKCHTCCINSSMKYWAAGQPAKIIFFIPNATDGACADKNMSQE